MTHGITYLTTPPHTLKHGTLNANIDTLSKQVSLSGIRSPFLYTYSHLPLLQFVYLINRMPKVGHSLGSTFAKLSNKALNPSKLRVFYCLCFPWLGPYSFHKLDPKSSPCVFLDYSITQSAFLYFDNTLQKIFVSSHVKFVKNVFLFASLSTSTTPIIDTNFALLAWSFTSCDYPTPPPPPPPPNYPYRRPPSN